MTLPYPLLLQKSARQALGISLKGHVVIIDEAHNLMDTISNIHSLQVNTSQLRHCRAQIDIYLQKFGRRLKGKNRVYIAQLVRLIDSISGFMGSRTEQDAVNGTVAISDLMAGKGVDQINLHKLVIYLQESKLAKKIDAYSVHAEEQKANNSRKNKPDHSLMTVPVLSHIQVFFQSLMNSAADGRFFIEKDQDNECTLKYMLLDPTFHFKEIVENARAVILAGGTMSPVHRTVP